MKYFSLDNLLATILVLGVLRYFPIIFNANVFDPIQSTFEDLELTDIVFSQMRDRTKVPFDTNIVLVNQGNLSRGSLSKVMDILNRNEPKVIGIDALFRKVGKNPQHDTMLANSFDNTKNLVLAFALGFKSNSKSDLFDTVMTSHPFIKGKAQEGYVNVITDQKNFRTIREMTPKQTVRNKTELAFPIKTASIFAPEKVKRFLARDNEREMINYKRNLDKYRVLDVADVFEKQDSLQFLKDKIILIGYLGPDINTRVTEDIFFTPLNKSYVGKTQPDMYGVVTHANTISMILEEDYIKSTPEWVEEVLVFIIVFLNMVVFTYFRVKFAENSQALSVVMQFAEVFLIIVGTIYAMYWFNFEIQLFGAIVALLFSISAYEAYTDSVKPLAISGFNKVLGIFSKK
jgi:CHASE2 domain-containing sensor protein